jgi:hypothetical protein
MKYRRRIYYSAAQRAEIWDRWQRGESMSSIGRRFDRQSSSVFSVISPTGVRGHSESIGERLMRDLDALIALPPTPYNAYEKADMIFDPIH